MVTYTYALDERDKGHGWISVHAEDGGVIATRESWNGSEIEKEIKRLQSYIPTPGHMIPLGDPRWYTHCQWCGESTEGQHPAYLIGQWHTSDCYKHAFKDR